MKTVNEVSKLTGVSVRTLHYYDAIGLLRPTMQTEANYRLYDDAALERLQYILLFRELQFPLKEIKDILFSPVFDRDKALDQQIALLKLKREHIDGLIELARETKKNGVNQMNFKAFDTKKMDEYAAEAKKKWGDTKAYEEYEVKSKDRSKENNRNIAEGLMNIFTEMGKLRELSPEDRQVQNQVKALQDYITMYYYTCTNKILAGLGQMYAAGGEMTDNIDKAGGTGTAVFTSKAIQVYCR